MNGRFSKHYHLTIAAFPCVSSLSTYEALIINQAKPPHCDTYCYMTMVKQIKALRTFIWNCNVVDIITINTTIIHSIHGPKYCLIKHFLKSKTNAHN